MYLCEICECMEIEKKQQKTEQKIPRCGPKKAKMLFFLLFLNYFSQYRSLMPNNLTKVLWTMILPVVSRLLKIHGVLLSVLRCVCTCTSLKTNLLILKNTQCEAVQPLLNSDPCGCRWSLQGILIVFTIRSSQRANHVRLNFIPAWKNKQELI